MSVSTATEPYRLTASEVLARINSGELTVEQYARSLLTRIKPRDPVVKAWAYLDPEHVIEEARRLDEVPIDKRGPFHGVAIAVKDVIYTKGQWQPGQDYLCFSGNLTTCSP